MKRMKYLFVGVLSIGLVFSACNKEDDEEANTPSKESMLTGTWKVTALTVDPAIDFFGTPISDWYNSAFYPDCVKDNLFQFDSDKSYEFNEGSSKCDDADPFIIETGTWEFNSDKTLILTTPTGGQTEEQEYEKLTSKELVITYTEFDSTTMVNYKFTQVMTKQ